MKTKKEIKKRIKEIESSLNFNRFILNEFKSTYYDKLEAMNLIEKLHTEKYTLQYVIGIFDKDDNTDELPF
tara:strand:- start:144 stop:356 length:213 start_codon:yes stop_codon:yes gene_type:complete